MVRPHSPVPRWLAFAGVLLLPAVALVGLLPAADNPAKPAKLSVYVGTYTGGPSKGIYQFEMDLATGRLTPRGLAGETPSPSFLAIHPSHKFLYAVNEVGNFDGKKNTGGISAFAIDAWTGRLKLLNQQPSGGGFPCYIVTDRSGKNVLAANYGGGSACVVPVGQGGRLGKPTVVIQHKGSSVNKQRQEAPHAHSINLDPANKFAFVADLGLDKVMIYRFDGKAGTLTPNDPPSVALPPGSGPRHLAFHPDGRHAYVINELKSTIAAMDYDPERGALKVVQTISTLPKDFKGESWTAEVVVHPSGKFVYGSNRGHDSIAIFTVDKKTGKLTAAGHQGKDVKTPRNFAIDPTGKYLIVANQGSNSLVVFRIDPESGQLTPTGIKVEAPVPVCVRMFPLKR